MSQLLQVLGALLLLSAFIAAQSGVLAGSSVTYLIANAAGSALLASIAVVGRDWGFLLLEGTWAVASTISLHRISSAGRSDTVDAAPERHSGTDSPTREPVPVPEARTVHVASDELGSTYRLIRFFRDSYTGSQGRQWLQPHIMWWSLTFLRDNGVHLDLATLTAPELRAKVTEMPLSAGHLEVLPVEQVELNFRLWWSILIDIARAVYRPRWHRVLFRPATRLPNFADLQRRAAQLGLHPWMSSATYEELAGIAHSLAVIDRHIRLRRAGPDDIMTDVLLPELLLAEMHWLHAPGGRASTPNRPRVDIVLLRRHAAAETRWINDRHLGPLSHMYLRAGDILGHLATLPDETRNSAVRSIMSMYEELRRADNSSEAAHR